MEKIITRFPPSPTGYLHVGGARTALFNWFYARHMKGRFILRIEDTDTNRSTQASVDAIFEALDWLNIDWDAGPYFQSKRFDIYAEYIEKLMAKGRGYYCTCSVERLAALRKKAMATGGKPKYDGACRDKNLGPSDNAVIRFKAPMSGTTPMKDAVKGHIVFQNSELDDFIIQRSDKTPTYNFVVVVDDITMGINTVIRGDDHVNNTPRQIQLYHAMEAPLPVFGHVPMVLGKDRTRLSKRHGAMSVTAYRDMGCLPDALINYLMRLAWSHGDQEFFTRSELIEKFTLENIGGSPGIFDPEKLLAVNAAHIKQTASTAISPLLAPFLRERGCDITGQTTGTSRVPDIIQVIDTLKTRSKTLTDMADGAAFYYKETITYRDKAADKFLVPRSIEPLKRLLEQLEKTDMFDQTNLEDAFKTVMEATGLKLGKIAQPVRVALTGKTVSPGIFEIMVVLGKDTTLSRIAAAIGEIKRRQPQ